MKSTAASLLFITALLLVTLLGASAQAVALPILAVPQANFYQQPDFNADIAQPQSVQSADIEMPEHLDKTSIQPSAPLSMRLRQSVARRDPYSILLAARQKHRQSKGSIATTYKARLLPVTGTITRPITKLKDQLDVFDVKLRAQSERLKLIAGPERMQRSWQAAQDQMRSKLHSLLKRVETTVHQAAEDLDQQTS